VATVVDEWRRKREGAGGRLSKQSSKQIATAAVRRLFCLLSYSLAARFSQASSGRWMSLKLGAFVAFDPSMTLLQTTHFAASPLILGTSEGVSEYRAPQCGQKKVRPSRSVPT
jgi:hypothetical protein